MKPSVVKKFAVMAALQVVLLAGAAWIAYTWHQRAAAGSGQSPWRDICFFIFAGLVMLIFVLGYACIDRCSRKEEAEQDRCKWYCFAATVALTLLLFALTIAYCLPPSLPTGPPQ